MTISTSGARPTCFASEARDEPCARGTGEAVRRQRRVGYLTSGVTLSGLPLARPSSAAGGRLGLFLAGLVGAQWFLGLTSLVLLAPTVLQIAHLPVADLIRITPILVAADDSRAG